MSRRLLLVAAFILGLAFGPADARAQRVDIYGWFGTDAVLPTPTATDFVAGASGTDQITVLVWPNSGGKNWLFYVAATSPTMGGGKPITTLQWRSSDVPTWTPISQTGQLAYTGRGVEFVTIEFRSTLDWAIDKPGDYVADLQFGARF